MPLTQHAPDLWSAEQTFGWLGGTTPLAVRMTVLRLASGALIVHSPIEISPELRRELDALGRVGFIVIPWAHGKFAEQAAETWPGAQLLAAPKPGSGHESLRFSGSLADDPPAAWAGQIETHWVRGFRLNEVVLFHRPSRTLVITDLCFNIQRAPSRWAEFVYRADGMWRRFGPSWVIRFLAVSDRAALRESLERIGRWDFRRIVPGHGDILEDAGPEVLRAAWRP
jgi:hypothetical protein